MDEPQSIDMSNWMGATSDEIGSLPLRTVAIPGTHDAGMYRGMLPADYAKNQNLDFTGQLNAGVRFFDFRCGYFWRGGEIVANGFCDPRNGGELWSCPDGYYRTWDAVTTSTACATGWFGDKSPATFHRKLQGCGLQHDQGWGVACVGNDPDTPAFLVCGHGGTPAYVVNVSVSDAIGQITQWLAAHPKELVIIRTSPVSEAQRVNDAVVNALGNVAYLTGSTAPQDATVDELRGKVVLICDQYWSGSLRSVGYKSDTSGIEDEDTMFQYLNTCLNGVRPQGSHPTDDPTLLEVVACLTPGGEGHGLIPGNPQDLAKTFNPDMQKILNEDPPQPGGPVEANPGWKGRAINIFTVDYIDISTIAETIVRANFHIVR